MWLFLKIDRTAGKGTCFVVNDQKTAVKMAVDAAMQAGLGIAGQKVWHVRLRANQELTTGGSVTVEGTIFRVVHFPEGTET